MSDYKNISVKKLEGSRIEITGEISADVVRSFEDKALQELSADFSLPGFRPGHVPAKMVKEKVGEVRVWIEAGELALQKEYPEILKDALRQAQGGGPVGPPEVQITKLAPGNPLGFKIIVSVLPEVKLPDYKKIAKEKTQDSRQKTQETEVTDKELDDFIMDLRKARARHEKAIKEKTEDRGQKNQETEGELPVFDDEFAKSLGKFTDADDFTKKARENILEDKKLRAREKTRFDIIDKIIEEMNVELPDVLVRGELQRMMAQLEGDISRAGYSFADYLKHAGKSREELEKEWEPQATKRAKTQLMLFEIAKKENLKPDKAKVEESVKQLMAQYKDTDERRVRAYVEEALLNEAALEYLEKF